MRTPVNLGHLCTCARSWAPVQSPIRLCAPATTTHHGISIQCLRCTIMRVQAVKCNWARNGRSQPAQRLITRSTPTMSLGAHKTRCRLVSSATGSAVALAVVELRTPDEAAATKEPSPSQPAEPWAATEQLLNSIFQGFPHLSRPALCDAQACVKLCELLARVAAPEPDVVSHRRASSAQSSDAVRKKT